MRIYDGCPGPELQRLLDTEKALMDAVRAKHPEAFCTYHHVAMGDPGGWCLHVWGKILTDHHPTKLSAILAVLKSE